MLAWNATNRSCCGSITYPDQLVFRGLSYAARAKIPWPTRRECGSALQSDRNVKAKRDRPRSLPAQCTVTHRRSSHQPHRSTPPMECRGGAQSTFVSRCLNPVDHLCPDGLRLRNCSLSALAYLRLKILGAAWGATRRRGHNLGSARMRSQTN